MNTPESDGPLDPEQRARRVIDRRLAAAGWVVVGRDDLNLDAGVGVAVRELPLRPGHGRVDYLLFVDGVPVGVLEAKPEHHSLSGVEPQTARYAAGLPTYLRAPVDPLPFNFRSNGALVHFTNLLDPEPRSRALFEFPRPETLAEWLTAAPLAVWLRPGLAGTLGDPHGPSGGARPSSLRARLAALPPLEAPELVDADVEGDTPARRRRTLGLWPNQVQAITNLEASLRADRPRALLQMATGSGKTITAITAAYRLIKFGGARRILFLVDRKNLGEQAETEFESFVTPDDRRKFSELYNVQRLTSGTIADASKVVISTVQRLYSILQGKPEIDPTEEESSLFDRPGFESAVETSEPLPVVYNPKIPPEFFDVIFIDECHRSIYTLWRQVLEYFDAYLIGLTATPAAHTYGFFEGNVVQEYDHQRAVADGVNVPFEVYRIRTQITEQGSTIEASPEPILGLRDRRSGRERWVRAEDAITYQGKDLDRAVVAPDQIRLIVQTFRDRLPIEIFPGRKDEVPKTLVFAKDDRHAEDLVQIFRQEFGRGDAFCQKITYKTTGRKPKDLIADFRNQYDPRIVVTVDMIATGTDIKPIEIVMFFRTVKSRLYFEQMKGRGVRTVDDATLRSVSPSAHAKTHFVLVDCVGQTEVDVGDSRPLERKRSLSLATLLEQVALGTHDPDVYATVASRLLRLDGELVATAPETREHLASLADGTTLAELAGDLIRALDDDAALAAAASARAAEGLAADETPSPAALDAATLGLLRHAARPLATRPDLRRALVDAKVSLEQMIDIVSRDALLFAGATPESKEQAQALVQSFEEFLAEHRETVDALAFYYSIPYRDRPHFDDLQALAQAIQAPPRSWTPERLWRAYQVLDTGRVRGASTERMLTNLVSLVRFALKREDELVPFAERVGERFAGWLLQQEQAGRGFSDGQRRWLEMMRDHIATSLAVEVEDFGFTPFVEEGGLGKARQVFGEELDQVMRELNEVLAA